MSENKINIGGRLHSIATGNVVAGADEILDDIQNKKQNLINQETGQKIGALEEAVGTGGSIDARIEAAVGIETQRATEAENARYTKEETYSKEQLDNLITTPNQKYVTVEDYASLPESGEADTTYRVANWDGSLETPAVDITKYSEYAWDGTKYVFLSVKSQIEEVFDISAYHSGTTYADLAAALGTNGANVPTAVRKGGMSVKFVLSSDNKYVQYRLMSDSFNTTPSNWQGVDDEPTARSQNFVYSDSVYNFLGEYAILYNGNPELNTTDKSFTLPANTDIFHKNGRVTNPQAVTWLRSELTSNIVSVCYLVLNISDFSHKVIRGLELPKCSSDECIIALVDFNHYIIKCNTHWYTLNGVKLSNVFNESPSFSEYAVVLNGIPVLDTVNRTFTLPAGTHVSGKNRIIEVTSSDITWSRSEASYPYGSGFLVLNMTNESHRVIVGSKTPTIGVDECVIAYVAWQYDIVQGNFPSYYVDGKLISKSLYCHNYLSRPVFWRQGTIEIVKDRVEGAKISVKITGDCLFFLTDTWVTIQASDSYIDINNAQTVLLGIVKNNNGTYSLALKSYRDMFNEEFFVLTSIFYGNQSTGLYSIITEIDSTINALITYNGLTKPAKFWTFAKENNGLDKMQGVSKQNLYNKKYVGSFNFTVYSDSTLRAVLTPIRKISLIPNKKYILVQNGYADTYQYQVIDTSFHNIDGTQGYKTYPVEFTVPASGEINVMLRKKDNSDFTFSECENILNTKRIFELYDADAVVEDNNHLAQNNIANLWGSVEFLDGYFYGINPNAKPMIYQGLTANDAMTCCEVRVKPGSKLYTFTPYMMLAYLDENRNFLGGYYYIYSTNQPNVIPRVTEVPWNAYYAQISTRLSYKYETVVTECPFPSVGLESYRNVSKQLVPQTQIVQQELNRIYDRDKFVSNASQNNMSYWGTISVDNNGHLFLSSNSGLKINGLYTTIDKSTIGTNIKVTSIPSNGKIIRLGYYGSAVVGTGIRDADTWIDVFADKVELYNGNITGSVSTLKGTANLSENIAVNDEIELKIVKDSVYHHIVKIMKRYVVIGEIELTAYVDPNDSDHEYDQMRSWGAPAIWSGTDAITVSRLFFYSNCPQYAKLAIVGDSYVENMSRSRVSGWVRLLEDKIGSENLFISGQGGGTAATLLTKLPVELNLCRPKYVVLHTGTNDAGTGTETQINTYKERLLKLIDMVKAVNAIPILMTTPRVVNNGNDDIAFITTVNPWIKGLGYQYIDVAYCLSTGDGLTMDTNRMRPDLVHPNHIGAEAILNWVESNLHIIL